MFNETLLHIPRVTACRSSDDSCWEVQSKKLTIWTEPSPDEECVYINVYREKSPNMLRRVKAVTGVVLTPVIVADFINLKIRDSNLYFDMKDCAYERPSYKSIEFCPMFLWTMDCMNAIFIPGIKDRVEVEPLTLEQRVALDIAGELKRELQGIDSDSDSEDNED